jgi:hypothetical protein
VRAYPLKSGQTGHVNTRSRAWSCAVLAVASLACAGAARSQVPATQAAGKGIYKCIGPDGKPSLTDRRNPECMSSDQQELRPDGSIKRVVPPPPTADEQSKLDQELQALRETKASRDEAVKYDRLLLRRYPKEAVHDRARVNALERLRGAMTASERRLQELSGERRRLLEEAEFYKGRKMPDSLRQQIDTNAAGAAAQRELMKQQQGQIDDIDRQFDAERDRLRKLWGGAQPGTIGSVPRNDAVKPAR